MKKHIDRQNMNPYFFSPGTTEVTYQGYFVPLSCNEINQNINLNIMKIAALDEGELFALELDQLQPTEDPVDVISMGRRYLGYFFVTEDTVYYRAVQDFDGFTEERNQEIVKMIQNDDSFLTTSNIVCCEEGTPDVVDENGYHTYVEVLDKQRIFHYYNDYSEGTKDYMTMVWEKERGLVYYVCGTGEMFMHVEFGVDLEDRANYEFMAD